MKVACGQFTVSSNISHNFQIIKKLITKSVQSNVEVLFLPEASDYLAKNAGHSFRLSQKTNELLVKPIQEELKSLNAKNNKLSISIGIHEPDFKNNKTINKLLWIDDEGKIVHEYCKIHLFDVNIKNGPILKESNSVTPGNKILPPFPSPDPNFNIGFQICYDIRFPELSTLLFKKGANILTFPSAFTVKTGESHWKNLGRTRAIDNQSYVVMAAQCGEHQLIDEDEPNGEEIKRISYGNSLIIDPWGDVLVEGLKYNDDLPKDEDGDYLELCVADLDYERLTSIRENMPLLNHRRDVYSLIEN